MSLTSFFSISIDPFTLWNRMKAFGTIFWTVRRKMYRAKCRSRLLKFVRIGCLIYGHWTLNGEAARWKRWSLELLYWIQFLNELYGIVAIVNGFLCCFHTANQLVKSSVDVIFMTETVFNWVYVWWRRKEFRRLACEMVEFFSTTSAVNLKRAEIISYILTITFFIGSVLFAVVPLFTKRQTTPIGTVYFTLPRDQQWGRSFIYALNMMQIINAASFLFLDMLTIWIMWHVACKFSLLARELTIFEEKKLKFWIKRHQDALSYVNEINSIIAPLAVKSTFAVGMDIIISGLVATRNLNLVESTKFLSVTTFSLLRFVACSWVADTMTEKARNIAEKIYDSPWIYTSPRIRKMALLIMQRSQKSVAIHAAGFLSAWTLEFCSLVLYTIVTYLMTLRAVIRV